MSESTPARFTSPVRAVARSVAQRWVLKPVAWSTVRVTVIGRELIADVPRPFVAVANHASHLDAPLIIGALPRRLARFLAAGAAGDYFFDVWWRRGLTSLFFNAFPIDRSRSGQRGTDVRGLVQHDVPVLLFPEGTRSKSGTLGHFKPGAAALAATTDVPILPIALVGTHQAHPSGSHWPKPGRLPVVVIFAAPMRAAEGENPVEFTARVRTVISELVESNSPKVLTTKHPEGARP